MLPRLILAGRPVAIIGGHLSYFGTAATGVDECRAAVRQLIKEGADFIKITATGGSTRTSHPLRPSFNVEELRAICEEAHRFGKHAAAHCASSQGMVNALDAGIDTIIHGVHKDPDGADTYRPDITERIAEQGVFVNPTLGQGVARVRMLEDMENLTAEQQAELDAARQTSDARMDHFARMRDAGVVMAAGSDSAWSYYPMGDYQTDIEAHAMAGMSNMEAIVSATRDAARSCCIGLARRNARPRQAGRRPRSQRQPPRRPSRPPASSRRIPSRQPHRPPEPHLAPHSRWHYWRC